MSEEIIIDGIDVSECEHFKINRGFNCYKGYNCTDKECSDCYFKQLKRLEKENEELHRHCQICENFIDGIPCKPLRDMDYDLQKVINQRDKYIQALEEIREMLKKSMSLKSNAYNHFINVEKAIVKIDEVLNEQK